MSLPLRHTAAVLLVATLLSSRARGRTTEGARGPLAPPAPDSTAPSRHPHEFPGRTNPAAPALQADAPSTDPHLALPCPIRFTVDRLEDGWAVLEPVARDAPLFNLPLDTIPIPVKEGDRVRLCVFPGPDLPEFPHESPRAYGEVTRWDSEWVDARFLTRNLRLPRPLFLPELLQQQVFVLFADPTPPDNQDRYRHLRDQLSQFLPESPQLQLETEWSGTTLEGGIHTFPPTTSLGSRSHRCRILSTSNHQENQDERS